MNKIALTFLSLFLFLAVAAQDTTIDNSGSGGMRANGKIYVVVAVVVTILIGLFVYIIRVDRKISKLEKKQQ